MPTDSTGDQDTSIPLFLLGDTLLMQQTGNTGKINK